MVSRAHNELVRSLDLRHARIRHNTNARTPALLLQHVQNVLRRTVAEQLPQRLLVIWDTVFRDERDKLHRRIPRQRRLTEMRIRRDEVLRLAVKVREVTSAAARDQNLFPDAVRVLENGYPPAALAGFNGTHQA